MNFSDGCSAIGLECGLSFISQLFEALLRCIARLNNDLPITNSRWRRL
jgi:hypothetical protein